MKTQDDDHPSLGDLPNIAQAAGKEKWYECYQARISRVERDYGYPGSSTE